MDLVFEERGSRRWFVAHATEVLAVLLVSALGAGARLGRTRGAGPLAALEEVLALVFDRHAATAPFGVLRLQFHKPCPVIHDPRSFLEIPESDK
jgi:hypothetical protein